ncbi:MAG: NUDIX domain-containing protein [Rothia sp. (in: high G+C Gram-positive bacteria)]|nr:NUDIX domain-containing protein [Rothia sp. (in: high G+C Gram-positive bacteria)]
MDTRPAAYAVIIDNEHILLSRWVPHIPGMQPGWTLPGGGMEPGEQPGESAVREVFEETGYTVELDELLGVNTAYYPPAEGSELPFCALRIIFRARTVGGELTHEIGGSTDRAAWIPLSELDQHFYYPSVDEAARLLGYPHAVALAEHYRSLGTDTEKKES